MESPCTRLHADTGSSLRLHTTGNSKMQHKQKHYYLICPTGPVPLPLDKHFFFGRAEGNNIVVDDARASRRHAELYWDGSDFVLIDLNSSNGTFVNGNKITSHVLKDSEVIQIGFMSYTYRAVASVQELETQVQKLRKDSRGQATVEMPALQGDALPETDFNGTLAIMSLPEICQMIGLGRRSGMLLTVNEKKEKGILYFRDGQIFSAECGLLKGDEAVLHILQFRQGSFSFRARHPNPDANVTQKTPHLLMEAARLADENKA